MSKNVLPHSSVIRKHTEEYLEDAEELAIKSISKLKKSTAYRNIYKTTLATDAVLSGLSELLTPHPSVLRSTIRKIPVHISLSQTKAAFFELRQFIETVYWVVYFSQHPVEWKAYIDGGTTGYTTDPTSPITYNSNREPSFYRNYARERFTKEPSGLSIKAVTVLASRYSDLCKIVHGSNEAIKKNLIPAFELPTSKELEKFIVVYRAIASAGCIVLTSFNVSDFDLFPPANRAWFDWLVSAKLSKKIKSAPYGLRDAL